MTLVHFRRQRPLALPDAVELERRHSDIERAGREAWQTFAHRDDE